MLNVGDRVKLTPEAMKNELNIHILSCCEPGCCETYRSKYSDTEKTIEAEKWVGTVENIYDITVVKTRDEWSRWSRLWFAKDLVKIEEE